jgi:hypothetical protein
MTLTPYSDAALTTAMVATTMPATVAGWKCAAGTMNKLYLPGSCK